ncbi:hypothetical protein M0813_09048 [Anaeramoeba flamelloides]|uniref:Uncharacterized protein n=1 Tax=Anaeramoeba flamelloides TaxID=1746091 RepID=A0ABQ8X6D4_9EUKA|nr:hypothetical protein M0813_09048 [Anaeramoeba flamelloides]
MQDDKIFIIIAFYQTYKLEHIGIIQEINIVLTDNGGLLNYVKVVNFDQRKHIKIENLLKEYQYLNYIEKLDTLDQNELGGIYHFILIKDNSYDQKIKEFIFVINETTSIEPSQNHIILPLIFYSDDFSFNASMDQQVDTQIDGIYMTFASQKRGIRKLKTSHYPITFIPKSKDFYTTLEPIINDLLLLEKGIVINEDSNEKLVVFSPVLLWITDLVEKAKILGIKSPTGKTKNPCFNCDTGFDHWALNKKINIF